MYMLLILRSITQKSRMNLHDIHPAFSYVRKTSNVKYLKLITAVINSRYIFVCSVNHTIACYERRDF